MRSLFHGRRQTAELAADPGQRQPGRPGVVTLQADVGRSQITLRLGGDYTRGPVRRSEGGVDMTLVHQELRIETSSGDLRAVHPDLLALIGVLAFHPVLPEPEFVLETSFPTSDAVERALRRPWILPGVRVRSPGSAPTYEADQPAVLSYGGGVDSLAAHLLFPQVPLVHETPLASGGTPDFEDAADQLMHQLATAQRTTTVRDNLRQLYSIWGLPLWVSVYISSLVQQPRYVLSGSEMTGTYLLGGQRYAPRHKNLWYSVFRDIGVTVLPTSFLSEIGNARVVAYHSMNAMSAYCSVISRNDCGRCTKCLRRRVIRGAITESELVLVDDFQRSSEVDDFLARRPLYYGDVFTHAVGLHKRLTWVLPALEDLVQAHGRLSFHDAYYPDAFEDFFYPDEYASQARASLAEVGIRPFDAQDRAAFTGFSQI